MREKIIRGCATKTDSEKSIHQIWKENNMARNLKKGNLMEYEMKMGDKKWTTENVTVKTYFETNEDIPEFPFLGILTTFDTFSKDI